jgi:hypothetical protein
VRPLLKTMLEPPTTREPAIGSKIDLLSEEGEEAAGEEHVPTASELLEKSSPLRARSRSGIRKAVANIIKEWTGANAS